MQQFDAMETLSPQGFLAFRDRLIPASGFQSHQMREIEILLGLPDETRLKYDGTDPLDPADDQIAGLVNFADAKTGDSTTAPNAESDDTAGLTPFIDADAFEFAYLMKNDLMFVKSYPTYPNRVYNEVAGLSISMLSVMEKHLLFIKRQFNEDHTIVRFYHI